MSPPILTVFVSAAVGGGSSCCVCETYVCTCIGVRLKVPRYTPAQPSHDTGVVRFAFSMEESKRTGSRLNAALMRLLVSTQAVTVVSLLQARGWEVRRRVS